MKLGISELAWNNTDNLESILNYLQKNNINFIETIIPKHVNWKDVNLSKLYNLQSLYKSYDIEILSTQSILYNSDIKSLYDNEFIDHIILVSDICNELNIKNLVLGAPSIRNNKFDFDRLTLIFSIIDNILRERNQILLLEPNSRIYNGNYFFTVAEIVNFIMHAKFSNIKTMIDTHNILNEKQIPSNICSAYHKHIKHVHVSENNLTNFKNSIEHVKLADMLRNINYNGIVVYECMNTTTLFNDIKLFSNIYNK